MELFKAHEQWRTRPEDERFPDLTSLYQQTRWYADHAAEKVVAWNDIRVEDRNGDLVLMGKADVPARFTHWAFGQVCRAIAAPADYLRALPATLAGQNINHGLKHADKLNDANLLFHQNGDLVLRAATSEIYSRLWNWEVAERLMDLQARGWEPATPDFNKRTDGKSDTALYASDHDMFAFVRLTDKTISEAGVDEPIYKGLITWNSEVGGGSYGAMKFMYRRMCGNHIIWDASDVVELKVRHVGDIRSKFSDYDILIKEYADESVSDIEAKIKSSKETLIGATKDEVLDAVFGKRNLGLTRKLLSAGYDACIEEQDGSPRTTWGLVQGLTRHSQTIPYADQRTAIDKGAAKLLEAF